MIVQTSPAEPPTSSSPLPKEQMGPDMVISYVLSCSEIKEVAGGKVFMDVGGRGGELLAFAATISRLSLVLNILRSNMKAATVGSESLMRNTGLIQGDAQHLPIQSDSMDVVLSAHTLEHLPDYRLAIREMKRVLKEDGDLIIVLPNRSTVSGYNLLHPRTLLRILVTKRLPAGETAKPYAEASANGPTYHGWINDFEPRTFSQCLEEEGLRIMNTRQGFFLFSGVLRCLYLLPDAVLQLVQSRTPGDSLSHRQEEARRSQQNNSRERLSLRSMKALLRMPRNILFKMSRLVLIIDALEGKILFWRQGGMFMIHAKKVREG